MLCLSAAASLLKTDFITWRSAAHCPKLALPTAHCKVLSELLPHQSRVRSRKCDQLLIGSSAPHCLQISVTLHLDHVSKAEPGTLEALNGKSARRG